MTARLWLALMFVLLTAGFAAPAGAATRSVSYSTWSIEGSVVRLRFILPMGEAKRLVPDVPRLDAAGASAAAGPLLSVSSAGGECTALVQNQWVGKYYVLAVAGGAYRFEMSFQCPDATGIVLHDKVLFDRARDHIDYARVQIGAGKPVLRLFTREHQDIALPALGPAPSESPAPFARQGAERLLGGADVMALVVGMLLLARRWRDLVDIALALAIGYAAAFLVGWGGAVAPDEAVAQAGLGAAAAILGLCALRLQASEQAAARGWRIAGAIGAGIACAALLAAGAFKGLSAGLAAGGLAAFGLALAWLAGGGPRVRLVLFAPAALFGLLDGTAWAEGLARLQMPGSSLAPALFGYDFGAFAGLAVAAAVAMAALWIAGRRLKPVQPFGADLTAAALTGMGLFWFVSKLYSV